MTIYEIAEKAGVSASTVSRVINNKVSNTKTKEKVQKVLDEYNFHLNETARSLSTNKTNLIGILVADIRNSHYTEMAYECETNLLEKGYCSIIINAGTTFSRMESSIEILSQRQVDGAIIIGSIFQNKTVEKSIRKHFKTKPIIFLNGTLPNKNIKNIVVAEDEGVKDCVRLLNENNYKSPLFLSWMDTPSTKLKINGYLKGLEKYEMDGKQLSLINNEINKDLRELEKYLDNTKDIDSIICSDDYLATLVIKMLNDKKISIPKDMGVIGINNSSFCNMTSPSLTSLNNKMGELGQLGAQTLINLIDKKHVSKKIQLFPEIVIRESINIIKKEQL
ncbi:MAG: LacI family DNA-binding transcriptional regulator [Pleomorphochaeta sp.]